MYGCLDENNHNSIKLFTIDKLTESIVPPTVAAYIHDYQNLNIREYSNEYIE